MPFFVQKGKKALEAFFIWIECKTFKEKNLVFQARGEKYDEERNSSGICSNDHFMCLWIGH